MSNKNAFKCLLAPLAVTFFVWQFALLSLPYGNHLAAVYLPESKPENIFDYLFYSRPSRLLSRVYTDYAPLDCHPHMMFWQEREGLKSIPIDLAAWITAYDENKGRRNNNERALSLILRLIEACPLNEGDSMPPLSAAVLAGDIELVGALLRSKADPYFGYLSQRGNHICPIVVATTMRDLSVKKSLPQDVKKYELMIQAMKRAGEELHGRKEFTACADLDTPE